MDFLILNNSFMSVACLLLKDMMRGSKDSLVYEEYQDS